MSDEAVRVWDNEDKEITGNIEPWDSWEKVKAVKGFPGGLIAFLQTSTDSEGCGFHTPTIVQAYAWPILQSGKDLVGVAKTGSGKTLAFLLPGFIKLRRLKKTQEVDTKRGPGLLCMTPTRELCYQIFSDTEKFGKPVQLTVACAYGGEPKRNQEWKIKEGPDCLIATPGRLNDFADSGVVQLDQVRFAVLDEADRMLDMGFEPQIKQILDRVPWERQTSMFTATWPRDCRDLAKRYIKDPVQIQIGSDDITTNQNIEQKVEICGNDGEKMDALKRILGSLREAGNCLVFSNTKKKCRELCWELNQDKGLGLWTEELHGDLDQSQRDASLNKFRSGEARVLAATDVAARGLDIRNIEIVVNYDCPKNTEDYVHRIGRTGRASDRGEAYTLLASWGDEKNAANIITVMEKANQEVPDNLKKLAGVGGGSSNGWADKKDDWKKSDWQQDEKKDDKKDEWWKKDEAEGEKGGGGGGEEWKSKEEAWKSKEDGDADEGKKSDEWKKNDEWKQEDWKKAVLSRDEGQGDSAAKAAEPEDDGNKRKALWDLLDAPPAKAAHTEDAED